MDEFLVECAEEQADIVGRLMCEAYKHASDECYKWHMKHQEWFPNNDAPTFAFNLDGGYKVGDNYLETH